MRQIKITNNITSRESLALDKYLSDINKIDLLTIEEEAELAKRIKEGDDQALDILTKANLRFVVSVAKKYQNNGLSLSDLINEGNIGLIKAARRFDETKGFKFISYAVWWIRQSILQAIVEHSRIIRLPHNKMNNLSKISEVFLSFAQKFEREPTYEELSELLDIPVAEVKVILQSTGRHQSTDAPLSDEENALSLIDTISDPSITSPDQILLQQSIRDEIKFGLSFLAPKEEKILKAFFGIDHVKSMTLEEISEYYNTSKERVRQIKERALRKLRKIMIRKSINPGIV